MTRVSEYEEPPHGVLHAALGEQVEGLTIGVSPVEAVMRGGTALRGRRRLAMTSGLAALAVLPVAAVAVFGGGGGGGPEGASPGGTVRSTATAGPNTPPGPPATPTQSGTPATTTTTAHLKPLPSPTITLPDMSTGQPFAPDPHDEYTVITSGTFGGQPWRLVRDRFVVPADDASALHGGHLPLSQAGHPGTENCEFTGLQWGDRALGTSPDFEAGGACGARDMQKVTDSLMGGDTGSPEGKDYPLMQAVGAVDAARVASVTITIGDEITARQPVVHLPGEQKGYYVVFLSKDALNRGSTTVTGYDSQGQVVDTAMLGHLGAH